MVGVEGVCLRFFLGGGSLADLPILENMHGVLQTLSHLRQPVRPETERRTAIRQTVPKKASVEAETSKIVTKGCILMNF